MLIAGHWDVLTNQSSLLLSSESMTGMNKPLGSDRQIKKQNPKKKKKLQQIWPGGSKRIPLSHPNAAGPNVFFIAQNAPHMDISTQCTATKLRANCPILGNYKSWKLEM